MELLNSPRTPHLLRIWSDLCRFEEIPQLDRWLAARLKQEKKFGSKDRRWYGDAIYFIVRQALAASGDDRQPSEVWNSLRKLPAEEMLRLCESFEAEMGTLSSAGMNAWFRGFYDRRVEASNWSSEQQGTFLKLQNQRAPLWLRLVRAKDKSLVEAELVKLGLSGTWFGQALQIQDAKNIKDSPILAQGWMEVQDLGSQLLGESIALPEGKGRIWDACAGGGAKSLHHAARFPLAEIIASDVRAYKSEEVKKRAERSRLKNVRAIPWDGSAHFQRPASAAKGFDAILVDAPCSGSGTWRRNPDARLRHSQANIEELAALQQKILSHVAAHLAPTGILVYATCSWFVEENEAVCEAFAKKHGFAIVQQALHGAPLEDADTLFSCHMRRV